MDDLKLPNASFEELKKNTPVRTADCNQELGNTKQQRSLKDAVHIELGLSGVSAAGHSAAQC
jgi:hypothetical protein